MSITKKEPAVTAGIVRLLLLAAAHYGVGLSGEELLAAFVAVEAVVTALLRRKVTPV